jgi:hypothetical protein
LVYQASTTTIETQLPPAPREPLDENERVYAVVFPFTASRSTGLAVTKSPFAVMAIV